MGADDAKADAAVILIEMRNRWDNAKADHLPPERQERMAIAWARLRLMDKYESEFARQKRTRSLNARIASRWEAEMPPTDPPQPERTLSELDTREVSDIVNRLPERMRLMLVSLLYEGKTQAEVAIEMGVSQPAISAMYERAREQLRELLKPFTGKSA